MTRINAAKRSKLIWFALINYMKLKIIAYAAYTAQLSRYISADIIINAISVMFFTIPCINVCILGVTMCVKTTSSSCNIYIKAVFTRVASFCAGVNVRFSFFFFLPNYCNGNYNNLNKYELLSYAKRNSIPVDTRDNRQQNYPMIG